MAERQMAVREAGYAAVRVDAPCYSAIVTERFLVRSMVLLDTDRWAIG